MDADLRKSARRGQCTTNFEMIMRACYGPLLTKRKDGRGYNVAPLRTHRKETGGEGAHGSCRRCPGRRIRTTAGEVRAVADRLATQLFPHL
ncbi:hypothetical protein [Streptomyces solaniscabiei]|uniref:hypothetical protein n=1 Tax=Streptomyces solaniscabiei TaxID=2683255 RepID=UPI001CE236EA|nr:hypothetical protein [Streptomyces solaniscabiei]